MTSSMLAGERRYFIRYIYVAWFLICNCYKLGPISLGVLLYIRTVAHEEIEASNLEWSFFFFVKWNYVLKWKDFLQKLKRAYPSHQLKMIISIKFLSTKQ